MHNFGGVTLSYELFDGGRRNSEINDAQTLLSQAELSLTKAEEEVAVQVEKAYDKVEQLRGLVGVADEAMRTRAEAARLADRQFEQTAVLASARAEAHAKSISAKSSVFEAIWALFLAQGELTKAMGQLPS